MNRNNDICNSVTRKVPFGCGNVYVTISVDNGVGQPTQVLVQAGKAGCCQRAIMEALLRMLNMHLDDDKPLEDIIHELMGIRCDQGIAGPGRLSCVDAIAFGLKAYTVPSRSLSDT